MATSQNNLRERLKPMVRPLNDSSVPGPKIAARVLERYAMVVLMPLLKTRLVVAVSSMNSLSKNQERLHNLDQTQTGAWNHVRNRGQGFSPSFEVAPRGDEQRRGDRAHRGTEAHRQINQ